MVRALAHSLPRAALLRWRAGVLIAVLIAGARWTPIAGAAPTAGRPSPEARSEYDKGTTAYNLGQFDQAVAAFTRAYELDPAPILLFNIAQAHWKKGDRERALFFYRRFLEADPGTDQRERVEARIRELEAAERASQEVAAVPVAPIPTRLQPPPEPPVMVKATEPPPAPALYRRPWFWVVMGGIALGAGAVALAAQRSGGNGWSCPGCRLGIIAVKDP
jgi:tetratricopeptide (TPR) repeat protein